MPWGPSVGDSVTLTDLAAAAADYSPRLVGAPVAVRDLHHDSRMVEPGDGFVAIVGEHADGHDFAASAMAHGAGALVVEREVPADLPQLIVSDTRMALPVLAATVHGHPSRELSVVGITGTNGKTTVAYMLEAIAAEAGRTPGIVGTIGARIAGTRVPLGRTTPEATELQRLLRRMRGAEVDFVALEVSSHALLLGRADAIDFDVVAFTNLSRDHLDFHGTMEAYAAAKARLFEAERAGRAVIWVDDPVGADIAAATPLDVTTVGMSPHRDVAGEILELRPTGSVVDVHTATGSGRLEIPLAGSFNAANALVAAACAFELGIDLPTVAAGLRSLGTVPGRFELVERGQDFTVVVDYAHTPDAITAVVETARELTEGRVIVVIGAGGDRDREKRPAMGSAAATADIAVITSDNPRSEDAATIAGAVLSGVPGSRAVHLELDRAAAIEGAVAAAAPADIVLILGKGHELGQETAGVVTPFDDVAVAAAAIEARRTT